MARKEDERKLAPKNGDPGQGCRFGMPPLIASGTSA